MLARTVVDGGVDPARNVELVMLLRATMGERSSGGEETAAQRLEAWYRALADVPTWALDQAVTRWLRGDVADILPKANPAYAPRPPELVQLAKAIYYAARWEHDRLRRLLVAKVVPLPAEKPPRALPKPALPRVDLSLDGPALPATQPLPAADKALIDLAARIGAENITEAMIEEIQRGAK